MTVDMCLRVSSPVVLGNCNGVLTEERLRRLRGRER